MIASRKDPFLQMVIKPKYFPSNTFWKAPINTPKVFWSSILKIKHHLHTNCTFQIHAGNTNIWTEPWCLSWEKIHSHLIIPTTQNTLPNSVRDLWDTETDHWNINLTYQTFGPVITDEISSLQRVNAQEDDKLRLTPSTTGNCSAKDAYRYVAKTRQTPLPQQGTRALSQHLIHCLTRVWKNKIISPRVKTFVWCLLRNAIATGSRVARFSQKIDKNYIRCGTIENDMHLFFTCHFARAVWFTGTTPIRTDNLPQQQDGVQQALTLLLPATCSDDVLQEVFTRLWNIWKARNDLRFNNKACTVHQVHHETKADLANSLSITMQEQMIAQTAQQPHTHNTHTTQTNSQVQCFTDAATDLDARPGRSREAGIGILFILQDNRHTISIQAKHPNCDSVIQAEGQAILLATRIAKTLGFRDTTYLRQSDASQCGQDNVSPRCWAMET
ncbi:hypothetical protein BS78_01G254200 [Paspalum vaginatum]|nr:hypothetical protein BS78_01G254200 [Paspalum vaginatum]